MAGLHTRGPATTLRMTPEATADVVEPAGLKLREIFNMAPYHYGAIFEKLPRAPIE